MKCFSLFLLQIIFFGSVFNPFFYQDFKSFDGFALKNHSREIYDSLNCKKLSYSVFEIAYKGYVYLKEKKQIENERFLTIIDFSKPSTEKRLFVIDLLMKQVVFKELVIHAEKTGELYAESFSNLIESEKNSIGFFVTGRSYWIKSSYSLKLLGLEKGYNNNAFKRGIVLHGTDNVLKKKSKGCFVVSNEVCYSMIETIKNGSCLFVYYPDEEYHKNSISNSIINKQEN